MVVLIVIYFLILADYSTGDSHGISGIVSNQTESIIKPRNSHEMKHVKMEPLPINAGTRAMFRTVPLTTTINEVDQNGNGMTIFGGHVLIEQK